MTTARGIRNNNPGNIRRTSPPTPWQGLAAEQPDPAFVTFTTPAHGIRALARVLLSYQDKHGLRSVRDIIYRWAPPSDGNATDAYVAAVSAALGEGVSDVDLHDHENMRRIVTAIIKHENGSQPYDARTIDKGLLMAGIEPKTPGRSLASSRTVAGGTVASVAGLASAAADLQEIQAALTPAAEYLPSLRYVLLALVVLGAALTIYARIDDWRRGLR